MSVHNCALVACEQSSGVSDEEEKASSGMSHVTKGHKLSLLPVDSNLNDSDSDYEDELRKYSQHSNSALISKRSYRSESELANKLQVAPSQSYMPTVGDCNEGRGK